MNTDAPRPRRLRNTPAIRALSRETHVSAADFVAPLFLVPGSGVKEEISAMPGVFRHSLDRIEQTVEGISESGVQAVILFGIPDSKDATGSDTVSDQGIIQRSVRLLRASFPDLHIMTDVCLCEYTDHGHCGLVRDGRILNDETLPLLAQQAVSHAESGADMVAPSGMMDGAVRAIRDGLDNAGFHDTGQMAYSVKYASSFYGPFREAVQSAPGFGDRSTYQMDPANHREAIREAELDIQEGADIIMVKPALAYLDIVRMLRDRIHTPIATYNVSGEYSMIMAADKMGWIDGGRVMMESLLSMKRAGADIIITYFAERAARVLQQARQ